MYYIMSFQKMHGAVYVHPEQSRSGYTQSANLRGYSFEKNPFKFYAFGTNGMLNITYKF